jgi:hypothetical protein
MNLIVVAAIIDTLSPSPRFTRQLPDLILKPARQITMASKMKTPESCTTKICDDEIKEQTITLY